MKKLILLLFIPLVFSCGEDKKKPEAYIVIQVSTDDSTKVDEVIQIIKKRVYSLLKTTPKITYTDDYGRVILKISKNTVQDFWVGKDDFRSSQMNAEKSENFSPSEIKRIKGLIETKGQLEFWNTFKGEEFLSFIIQANEIIKSKTSSEKINQIELNEIELLLGSENDDIAIDSNPILDLIKGQDYPGGAVVAMFDSKDINIISEYLSDPDVRSLLPPSHRYVKFLWGIPQMSEEGEELVKLYALKGNREKTPQLSGSVITDARQSYGVDGISPTVIMQMNNKGAKIWGEMTDNAFKQESQIAIVLDDIVYSAPLVIGPISDGSCQIFGAFNLNEAIDIANVLRAGNLPASVEIVQDIWDEQPILDRFSQF